MLVMISGKQGSGKTSTADELQKAFTARGIVCWRYRFAQPIYDMHNAVYQVGKSYGIELTGAKDGELLQLLGTEWGRNTKGQDIWIKAAQKRCSDVYSVWEEKRLAWVIIIDDLRFENEFDAFPAALKVRLEAPEEVRKARASYWRENTQHQSEIDLDKYAAKGKFHLKLDTAAVPLADVVASITKFHHDLTTKSIEKALAGA